jgi:hypothetical protein
MTTPVVLANELPLSGTLQGIAYHPDGMARRERERAWAEDAALVSALRDGTIPEPLVDRAFAVRRQSNLIMDAGKAYLSDAWQGTVTLNNMKFHGNGTGTAGGTDPTLLQLGAEIRALTPPDLRATGTTVEGASPKIFRTVATLVFANPVNVTEWGLFSLVGTATSPTVPSGVMFSRVVFTAIVLTQSGDQIQWTYECTLG